MQILKSRAVRLIFGLAFLLFSVSFLIIGILEDSYFVYMPVAVVMLLISNIIFAVDNISENILFIVFQLTFFIFLISGPLIDAIDGQDYFTDFSTDIAKKTLLCYWLAVFAMWCYQVVKMLKIRFKFIPTNQAVMLKHKSHISKYDTQKVRIISLVSFYICALAFVLVTLEKIMFRQVNTLQDYYSTYTSNLPTFVVKISDCYLIAFALYLATMPSKKQIKLPVIFFMLISALTLLYGVRNIIILNLLFLIVYAVFRNKIDGIKWVTKKMVVAGAVSLPIIIILLQAFDKFRRSVAFNISQISDFFSFKLIRDFFESQSMSSMILSNSMKYQNILFGQPVPYSLGTIYTYLTQNMIFRAITGAEAYNSNSVEAAMHSGNLGARLAFELYPVTFLKGTGMGGNYTADLFADWSFVGVFLGSLLICFIISKVSKIVQHDSPFIVAFALVAIRWIAYTPRDSYFAWAMQSFSFMNILFVLLVYVLSTIGVHKVQHKTEE